MEEHFLWGHIGLFSWYGCEGLFLVRPPEDFENQFCDLGWCWGAGALQGYRDTGVAYRDTGIQGLPTGIQGIQRSPTGDIESQN